MSNVVSLFPAHESPDARDCTVGIVLDAAAIADDLQTLVSRLEEIGADIAAAHVDAALQALCKHASIVPDNSVSD